MIGQRKIGVLMGGLSAERDISIRSGEAVVAALTDRGYDAWPLFVDRDVDLVLRQARIDVAFVALHGRYGEDGCIQGVLELLGIPYTGSGVLASALAMNKVRAKEVFRLHNLPTAPGYVVQCDSGEDVLELHGSFGFPAIVKPAGEGSSLGIRVARDELELESAVEEALRFDDDVLVERFV
ncbi:MAG TPA: D-alanine--D-alanine ligase, partial [Polyangia bacterium]|nr:D-alanine--D-alanine ligase [Polyangia bacterium]